MGVRRFLAFQMIRWSICDSDDRQTCLVGALLCWGVRGVLP